MKGLKVTILVLVLLMAMAAPAFANTADDTPVERIEPQYRTEIHRKTDEFLFSNDIQNRLAEEGIKVVYTAPIDDSTVEIGIYPDEAAARETVLNLLVENTIGSSENFEVIHSEEVTIMPFTTDEPAEDAPDVIEDPDTPVSDEEGEARAGDSTGNDNDMDEEEYVRPDDENAEIGITSVDDLAADGEEESSNFLIPVFAVLGLGGAAGGIFYLKR